MALVAGMVSYLGLSGGDKTTNQLTTNQIPATNGGSFQQDNFNSVNGQGPSQGFDHSFGNDDSSQFSQNDQGFSDDNQQNDQGFSNDNQFFGDSNQQNQFSRGGRNHGHHGGFDTTTGGT